jgi:hypothetical protein
MRHQIKLRILKDFSAPSLKHLKTTLLSLLETADLSEENLFVAKFPKENQEKMLLYYSESFREF